MNYKTLIAFLGKRQLGPLRGGGWMLAVKEGENKWTDEFRAHKNIDVGDMVRFDYVVGTDAYDKPVVSAPNSFRGNADADYWYYEFPDGRSILIICDRGSIRNNIEAIKEAIVNQYDAVQWEQSIDRRNNIKLNI